MSLAPRVKPPSHDARPVAIKINPARAVVGFYDDPNPALHGFMRASDGTFTNPLPVASEPHTAGTRPTNNTATAGSIEDRMISSNDVDEMS